MPKFYIIIDRETTNCDNKLFLEDVECRECTDDYHEIEASDNYNIEIMDRETPNCGNKLFLEDTECRECTKCREYMDDYHEIEASGNYLTPIPNQLGYFSNENFYAPGITSSSDVKQLQPIVDVWNLSGTSKAHWRDNTVRIKMLSVPPLAPVIYSQVTVYCTDYNEAQVVRPQPLTYPRDIYFAFILVEFLNCPVPTPQLLNSAQYPFLAILYRDDVNLLVWGNYEDVNIEIH